MMQGSLLRANGAIANSRFGEFGFNFKPNRSAVTATCKCSHGIPLNSPNEVVQKVSEYLVTR